MKHYSLVILIVFLLSPVVVVVVAQQPTPAAASASPTIQAAPATPGRGGGRGSTNHSIDHCAAG